MNNNDVLIRLRYALNIPEPSVIELFGLGGHSVDKATLDGWFRKEEDPAFVECPDPAMEAFLQGLVTSRRGAREGGGTERPRRRPFLTNNDILKSLRIALGLKDEDMVAIMLLANVAVSKSEVSALFRKEGQPNYRPCGDQFLRNFLVGLTARSRA